MTTVPKALAAGDLCEAFACTVADRPDEVAMRSSDGSVSLTWSQVDGEVRSAAAGLAALGVAKDGTVAMMLTNRYEAPVVDLATLHLGAVPVSVYNSSATSQLTYLLDDSGADVLVTEAAFADKARSAIAATQRRPRLVVVDGEGEEPNWTALLALAEPLPTGLRPVLDPHDLLTVVYTSGTTGVPKGAELTHYNILEQIRGLHSLGRLPAGGRAVSYLPFAHMGDRLCAYYMPIVMGACDHLPPQPQTAAGLLPEIQPTLYMAVPRVWNYLMTLALAHGSPPTRRNGRAGGGRRTRLPHPRRPRGRPRDRRVGPHRVACARRGALGHPPPPRPGRRRAALHRRRATAPGDVALLRRHRRGPLRVLRPERDRRDHPLQPGRAPPGRSPTVCRCRASRRRSPRTANCC